MKTMIVYLVLLRNQDKKLNQQRKRYDTCFGLEEFTIVTFFIAIIHSICFSKYWIPPTAKFTWRQKWRQTLWAFQYNALPVEGIRPCVGHVMMFRFQFHVYGSIIHTTLFGNVRIFFACRLTRRNGFKHLFMFNILLSSKLGSIF